MKRILTVVLTALLVLAAASSQAQVSLTVAINRANYLLYETVYAKVVLRNYSGQALAFSDNAETTGFLKFTIDLPDHTKAEIRKSATNPLVGIIIKPGATEEVLVPLTSSYVITKPGNYRVKAILSHKLLNKEYQSEACTFSICNGLPVWERTMGVPDLFKKKSDDVLPPRKAKIVTFNDGRDKVYCLVLEDDKYVYGVARIGSDIGNFPPSCEVDGLCRIHVVIQVSPNVFSYFIYDINCELREKEVYVKTKTVPTLVLDNKEGSVVVVGGRKGVKDQDYAEENGIPVLTGDNE
ncbi:MAG: hypothetical protein WCS96_14880 [Victivallales bacterium]